MTRAALLYLASFTAHAAIAVGVVSLKGSRTHEDVAISMVESKKPKNKPVDDAPPPPPPPPKAEKAKAVPAPQKVAAAPPPAAPAAEAAAPSAPDFGLSLGNGGGDSSGLAVRSAAAAPTSSARSDQVSKKVLAAAPTPAAAAKTDECSEALIKPKVLSITQPGYTTDAREAGVAGKVRVELTVDASGNVSSARLLEGLGHGLDEAALAAARAATFAAGTKCGKPTVATFVVAIRFAL